MGTSRIQNKSHKSAEQWAISNFFFDFSLRPEPAINSRTFCCRKRREHVSHWNFHWRSPVVCGDKNNYYDDIARCSPFGWFFAPTSLRAELMQLNLIRSTTQRISIENGNWHQLMCDVFVLSSQSRIATSIEMPLKNQWRVVIFTGFHYATSFSQNSNVASLERRPWENHL